MPAAHESASFAIPLLTWRVLPPVTVGDPCCFACLWLFQEGAYGGDGGGSYVFINSLNKLTVSLVPCRSPLPHLPLQTHWRGGCHSHWPHTLPLEAVILDAANPLRCPSHLVAHDATEGNAVLPLSYVWHKGVSI